MRHVDSKMLAQLESFLEMAARSPRLFKRG